MKKGRGNDETRFIPFHHSYFTLLSIRHLWLHCFCLFEKDSQREGEREGEKEKCLFKWLVRK
jgi:hypothetical protein